MSKNFHFGAGSFTNELWIANKKVFTKPTDVSVEFVIGGEWDWIIADSAGAVVKTVRHKGNAGWTSINFPSLGLFGDYSIGFRNASPSEKKIRGGEVTYQ